MTRLTILFVFLGHSAHTWAQGHMNPGINIQEYIDKLYPIPDEDFDYSDWYESINQRLMNPIALNRTNQDELLSLKLLDLRQINNLMTYIKHNSPLLSIYELQVVDGFDAHTIRNILPFVTVLPQNDHATRGTLAQRILKEENAYLLLRSEKTLESQTGYSTTDSSGYLGSPLKIFGKFRTSHPGDFSMGFTFEKDPGEQLRFDSDQRLYGFDYYSYHLFLYEKGALKKMALGDYQMQFGQGLILGTGFNPGKGGETITSIKKSNLGLRPYTSAQEYGYMRGIGLTYAISQLEITPFYSRNKHDANIAVDSLSADQEEYISRFQNVGLHRTYEELASRHKITEHSAGLNITCNFLNTHHVQFGGTFLIHKRSLPIQKTINYHNQYDFRGNQNQNFGFFVNYYWQNFLFFSEIARSQSGGNALLAGLMGSLSPVLSVSFLYRQYDKNYHAFYGQGFGENNRNMNETGLYWGVKITPNHKSTLSAYYDYFKFPWLKYGVRMPSDGYEYLIRAEHQFSKKIKLNIQFRAQEKTKSPVQEGLPLYLPQAGTKRNYLIHLGVKANHAIELRSRLQYSTYHYAQMKTEGMAIMQDLIIRWKNITLSTRFALFDTEDYENRQYASEKDMNASFSMGNYAFQGHRNYLMLQYEPGRKMTFWLRYSRWDYENRNSIGSGLNSIDGNVKTDLKIQMRLKI